MNRIACLPKSASAKAAMVASILLLLALCAALMGMQSFPDLRDDDELRAEDMLEQGPDGHDESWFDVLISLEGDDEHYEESYDETDQDWEDEHDEVFDNLFDDLFDDRESDSDEGKYAQRGPASMPVAVLMPEPTPFTPSLSSQGELQAKHRLVLSAEVSGRVVLVSDQLARGKRVKAGTLLAKLDPLPYQSALVEAQANLAQATLALAQEQQRAQNALAEWRHSGLSEGNSEGKSEGERNVKHDSKQLTALVAREPQLALAKAQLNDAKVKVTLAQRRLAKTKIRAPFDALITQQSIERGAFLSEDEALATLISANDLEVYLPISVAQWQRLQMLRNGFEQGLAAPQADSNSSGNLSVSHNIGVTLLGEHGERWPATYSHQLGIVDTRSRQMSVVADVDNTSDSLAFKPALMAGMFVRAELAFPSQQQALQLPETAVSADGKVWLVNEHAQLVSFEAEVLFQQQGRVFLKPDPDLLTQASKGIVMQGSPSFRAGLKVNPVLVEDGAVL